MGGPLLKLCGVRREADVDYLNEFPPDYAGFVFAKSSRKVTPEEARTLAGRLDPKILPVGVFVNEPLERMIETARIAGLAVLQLHGDEDEAYIRALRRLAPDVEIWKAVRVRGAASIQQAAALPADRLLLDSFSRDAYGGTGKTADWEAVEAARIEKPFFLAGGLNPDNLAEALQRIRPAGVDLSGGIETDGRKDREKIRAVWNLIQDDRAARKAAGQ